MIGLQSRLTLRVPVIAGYEQETKMCPIGVQQMIEYDEFEPEKILSVYDAKTSMRGTVVIDSTVLGPGKGGIRMPRKCALNLGRMAEGKK